MENKMLSVTCAIIRNEENEVLIVQRGEDSDHPGKWEFPGGKIEHGESEEECIIREIREELSMDIVLYRRLPEVEHDYGTKQIRLLPFVCDTLDEIPMLSEHIDYRWIDLTQILTADYSDADLDVALSYHAMAAAEAKEDLSPVPEPVQSSADDADLQDMVNRMMGMKEAEWLAMSAIENPAIFLKLLDFSHSDDKKLAFRASWTLTKVCDRFPELIYPHLSRIVESLQKIDNESALRSFLRILSLTDPGKIDQKLHGLLADTCFNLLNSGFSAIAVKAYSMEILYRLSVHYPELGNELSATLRILLEDTSSGGIAARGHQILKKLAELPIARGSSR